MQDYSNAVIYKIFCRNIEVKDLYVDSTTNLVARPRSHKSCFKKQCQAVYSFIRAHGGWENCDLEVVEACPCADKAALLTRERYYIEQFGATVNDHVPTRTNQQYFQDNKAFLDANHRAYYAANRDRIHSHRNQNCENNPGCRKQRTECSCGRSMIKEGLARHQTTALHLRVLKALKSAEALPIPIL